MRRLWVGIGLFTCLLLGCYTLWQFYAPTARWVQVGYAALPGWETADLRPSLQAFQASCRWLEKRSPTKAVGNKTFRLTAQDWFPVCHEALALQQPSLEAVKLFFEHHFVPVHWAHPHDNEGLFTGYFSPVYKGSLQRTTDYTVPIYSVPTDLIRVQLALFDAKLPDRMLTGRVVKQQLRPYFTRAEIDKGQIAHQAKVLVWLKDEIDRIVLEIQGAGLVELPDGKQLALGYAAENGAPYRSIAKAFINRGIFTKDTASIKHMREYVKTHPSIGRDIINYNPSFVFFSMLSHPYTPSSLGFPLMEGYSMAVDKAWVPLGTPVWIDTQQPQKGKPSHAPLQRLMIAQDVGGAIKGKVRGDIFWGVGDQAAYLAERMKYKGSAWMLLPRDWKGFR